MFDVDRRPAVRHLVRDGRLIPFIGAGLSIPLGLPSWDTLIGIIADQLGYDPEVLKLNGNNLQLAEYYVAVKGSHRLASDYCDEPWARQARKMAHAKAQDPDRCRKIAEAKRGKRRPARVVAAIRKAARGRHLSPETRAKLSAAMRKRAKTFIPNGQRWTEEDNDLAGCCESRLGLAGWRALLGSPQLLPR